MGFEAGLAGELGWAISSSETGPKYFGLRAGFRPDFFEKLSPIRIGRSGQAKNAGKKERKNERKNEEVYFLKDSHQWEKGRPSKFYTIFKSSEKLKQRIL